METLGSRFGTCACGGAFEERVVPVTAKTGKKKTARLLEVEQGVCPVCKRRVYKTLSLLSVEAAFRALHLAPRGRLPATRAGSGRVAAR